MLQEEVEDLHESKEMAKEVPNRRKERRDQKQEVSCRRNALLPIVV